MATEAQRNAVAKLIPKNKSEALFDSAKDLIGVFEQYMDEVHKDDQAVPSVSNFTRWLDVNISPSSVFRLLNKFPEARDAIKPLIADELMEKGLKGKFKEATTIFSLKNQSDWTDKKESISKHEVGEIASAEEARQNIKMIMKSMGYDAKNRPRKETQANLDAMQDRIIQLAEAKANL